MKYSIILTAFGLFLVTWNDATAAVDPPAIETSITILMVKDKDVTDAQVAARVNFLKQTWNSTLLNSPLPTANPVVLTS